MRRVKIIYDGEQSFTYGELDTKSGTPTIEMAGTKYDLRQFARLKATVAVNDEETLELLQNYGINARPTGKQTMIGISVPEVFKDKLKAIARKRGKTVTKIIVEVMTEWIAENE